VQFRLLQHPERLPGEEDVAVLEIVEADELSRLHHTAKELFGALVGGNARGDGAAGQIPRSQQTARQLGKDSIGIDIAHGCRGKAPAAPLNDTQGLGVVAAWFPPTRHSYSSLRVIA